MTLPSQTKVVVLIQARMSSTRLPGKVLQLIDDKPVLWHVVNRARAAALVDEVVVITSERPENEPLREFCAAEHITCFSGDELDVLDRFYRAALAYKASHLVRLTADCPLVDPVLIDEVIRQVLQGNAEYCAVGTGAGVANEKNFRRFPDGMDAEAMIFGTLEKIWKDASRAADREHVTTYLFLNREKFRMKYLECATDLSSVRLTLDHAEDLELVRLLYAGLGKTNRIFGFDAVLAHLQLNPALTQINERHQHTQGYEVFWKK